MSSMAPTAPRRILPSGPTTSAARAGATANSSATPIARRTRKSRAAISSSPRKKRISLARTALRATTLPHGSKRKDFSAEPTAALKRASKFPRGRECGPLSGCWGTTSLPSAGPSAAKSTSWKTSARSPAPSTDRSTAPAPWPKRAMPPRRSREPASWATRSRTGDRTPTAQKQRRQVGKGTLSTSQARLL